MRLVSWNVNGIRSAARKGFTDFLAPINGDILCLQETKTAGRPVETALNGYHAYWSHAHKPGRHGTAVFTRNKPLSVAEGIGSRAHDAEGRVLTLRYPAFTLVNVYVPNSRRDLSRLVYRTRSWDVDFLSYVNALEKDDPVVFCGDLNVAHREIDLANPPANVGNHGFTPQERRGFENIVRSGFVDAFRALHPDRRQYTWWSPLKGCRERNIGWRIDYFLLSPKLLPLLRRADIHADIAGSDHCPVSIELDLGVKSPDFSSTRTLGPGNNIRA